MREAVANAGSLTIAVSPTARQTAEFLRQAEEFARKFQMKMKWDGDKRDVAGLSQRIADPMQKQPAPARRRA